jgi:hypothetical protein
MLKRKIWVSGLVIGLCILFAGITVFSSWMGGMTLGLMSNAEQASISNVRFVEGAPAGDTVKVTARNTGATSVAIQEGYANGIKATNTNSGQAFVIPKATALEITLTFPNGTLVYGTQQQVKLITAKGTNIMYSLTYDLTSTSQYDSIKDNATLPVPFPETASTLGQEWSAPQQTAVAVFSVVAVVTVLGACKLAHHIVGPKNKTELFVLLFFVSVIVVSAIVAIVNAVFFAPTFTL